MPDSVGTAGWLSDHRTGIGRDERQRQRAHILAGGRGPPAQIEEGWVQGPAPGAADRQQAPQVVQTSEEREGWATELVKGPEDDDERTVVQVSYVMRVRFDRFVSYHVFYGYHITIIIILWRSYYIFTHKVFTEVPNLF